MLGGEEYANDLTAWAWNADFNCSSGPGLVTDYVPGDPTAYGAADKSHLASVGLAR